MKLRFYRREVLRSDTVFERNINQLKTCNYINLYTSNWKSVRLLKGEKYLVAI